MEQTTRQEFLNDLCPRIRPLIAGVMECDCGCAVLDLFRRRPLTWLQAGDIAYHLQQPHEKVAAALNQIAESGIVERHTILRTTFYSLTRHEDVLNALEQFWVWRDYWQTHVTRVQDELHLRT